jgi:hypothetical protein
MHDLAQRMHAGIGAAGGDALHGLAAEFVDRLLQRLLHRRAVLLPLPADEGAAVIFEDELVARHAASSGSGRRVPRARR